MSKYTSMKGEVIMSLRINQLYEVIVEKDGKEMKVLVAAPNKLAISRNSKIILEVLFGSSGYYHVSMSPPVLVNNAVITVN